MERDHRGRAATIAQEANAMSDTYSKLYLHLVWATKYRADLLTPKVERFVHQRIRAIATQQDIDVIAINSAWDHTHVLAEWQPRHSIADIVRFWKPATSRTWNAQREQYERELYWQNGYGVFSLSQKQVPPVRQYVIQ